NEVHHMRNTLNAEAAILKVHCEVLTGCRHCEPPCRLDRNTISLRDCCGETHRDIEEFSRTTMRVCRSTRIVVCAFNRCGSKGCGSGRWKDERRSHGGRTGGHRQKMRPDPGALSKPP